MSEKIEKIDKVIKKEDCVKGEQMVQEYDDLALQFREACVICVTNQDMMNDMFATAVSKDKDVIDKYLKGDKIEDETALQAILQFEKLSIQYVIATRNRRELLAKFNKVKKLRDLFGQKIFKKYKLEPKTTYQINWKTGEISKVVEDKQNSN